jgi:non-specific serine/threonine protein kinase
MDARGIARFMAGDLDGARGWHERALAAYQECGCSEPFALNCPMRLASVCLLTGELDRVISLSEQCMRSCEEFGDQWARATALWIRATARWMAAEPDRAIEDAIACLVIKESLADLQWITMSIDLIAVCLVAQGEQERAAMLIGAGDALWKILGSQVQQGQGYIELRRAEAERCRHELGDEPFRAAYQRGTGLPVADAIALAKGETDLPEPAALDSPLTSRELEVAALVADGLGNREIAERLVVSKRTVDAHIDHIFAKLGFSARAQIAAWFSRTTS